MPVKTTVRKAAKTNDKAPTPRTEESKDAKGGARQEAGTAPKKKVCLFCTAEKEPSYTDIATLRRYLSDRARIMPKQRTGVCSKHQRRVTKHIKYARHLAMLPFINEV